MEGMESERHAHPGRGGDKHFYDSIETDEFVMPNVFEVEIRLADNQVCLSSALTCLGQNGYCGG